MPDTGGSAASTMVCFHPYEARWVDASGCFETCRECAESRRTRETGAWKPSHRVIMREGGRLKFFCRDGRLFRNVAARLT